MKTRSLLVLALFVTTSCSNAHTAESAHAFADKFIAAENKAWETGDVADLKTLEDTNVVYHLPGLEVKGWKAHEDYIVQGRQKIANLKQNWKYLSGEGSQFALAYDSSAMVLADGKNPAMNASNNYLFVFHVNDDKIAEVWVNGSATSTPVKVAEKPPAQAKKKARKKQ